MATVTDPGDLLDPDNTKPGAEEFSADAIACMIHLACITAALPVPETEHVSDTLSDSEQAPESHDDPMCTFCAEVNQTTELVHHAMAPSDGRQRACLEDVPVLHTKTLPDIGWGIAATIIWNFVATVLLYTTLFTLSVCLVRVLTYMKRDYGDHVFTGAVFLCLAVAVGTWKFCKTLIIATQKEKRD